MRTAFLDVETTEPSRHAIDFMNLFIPLYIQRDQPYGVFAAQTVNFKQIVDANGNRYYVWLTKIQKELNARRYRNLVEDDGRTFHEINEDNQIAFRKEELHDIRIIFTKLGSKQEYRFIGLFEPDPERSYPGHCYFRRIATKADFTVDPPIIYREESNEKTNNAIGEASAMKQTEWIVPCNPTKYDLESEFRNSDTVYWRQNANFETGDTVYIYLSGREGAIRYKTVVEETDVDAAEVNEEYWLDESMKSANPKRVCLRMVKAFDDSHLRVDALRKHGLKSTLQGPIKLIGELAEYIHEVDLYNRVISFPCGPTYDLVRSTFVHAHPLKKGFPDRKVRWLMVRKNGGISEEIFEVFDTVDAYPDQLEQMITPTQKSVLEYRDQRNREFGFKSIGCKYRFYLLRVAYRLVPPYIMSPNLQSYKYYELNEILNHDQESEQPHDINIAAVPLNVSIVDGIEKVVCANCHYQFIKAPRCPECGQLHQY